jgi:uncharacterized repeat protein (TIGR01451 family)
MAYDNTILSPGGIASKLIALLQRSGRTVLPFLLFSILLFFGIRLRAEGTKQLAPNPEDIVMLLIGNEVYGDFAKYDGPVNSRMYFRIKNPNEVVYLGLSRNFRANGEPESTGAYNFRIRRMSDGAVVHGPFTVHAFNENVTTWEDATLGPAAITGQGYETTDSRFFFDPSEAGEYFIEFDGATHIGYWDVTVAAGNQIQPGRLYSTNWAFRTPAQENVAPECVWDREFNGILYSYTSDGFVTKIDFSNSGFQGLSFNVAFNRTGPGTSGDPQLDRMSVEGENLTENSAEHLIFLEEPDIDLFPDGDCGSASVGSAFECTPDGGYCLEATVTETGQVEIVLDFNKNGEFDEGLDVRLLEIFDDPNDLTSCISWDGIKGDGSSPAEGETVNLIVQYTQGVQHWALFDGEFLKNGFCVEPVRPGCDELQNNQLYWDDRNISDDPGTDAVKDGRLGCNCETDDCRTWNYFDPNTEDCRFINDNITEGYGDKSTLNTWWFARNVFTTFTDIPFPGTSIDGVNEICEGEQATLTMVSTSNDIVAITWEGPNGIISEGGADNTQIVVSQAGTYTVTMEQGSGCVAVATHDLAVTACPVDVELDKLVDVLNPEIGQLINYDIVLTNKGPGDATGITVEDQLPDGLTNITNISDGGVLTGNVITWENLSLAEGASLVLSYRARVGLGTSYTNLAEITEMDQQDIDSTPGNGVDTDGDGNVSDDPGDEDDGDGVVVVPQPCSLGASVTNVQCDDNGTPVDPTDDTFTFRVTVNAANASGTWIANDPGNSSGNYGEPFTFGPYPISGGVISFSIQDDFFGAICSIPISVTPPATCSNQCLIETSVTDLLCNDNGTPSDPDDDTYTFNLTVSGFNNGDGWSAGNVSGAYGETVAFGPFPISEGATQLTVVDNADATCVAEISVQAPGTCSGQCTISAETRNVICNDNGTPSDPSDDTFYFDVRVRGSNISENGWATTGGLQGTYGDWVTVGPYPIANGALTLNIQDGEEAGCTTSVTVQAPTTCSDVCLIEAQVSNIVCDNNGTLSDNGDDVFYFDVLVTGLNTADGWNSSLNHTGAYGEVLTMGPFSISDGNVSLIITDDGDDACTVDISVDAPPSCSDLCSIAADVRNIYCDDNGTGSDASDDIYYADIVVTGFNTSENGFRIGDLTGQYGQQITVGPFPIAGGDVNITVVDLDDTDCTVSVDLFAPTETCSDDCEIFAEVSNIVCDDNGTPTIREDDTFTFDVVVTGFNFSDNWETTEGATGAYGEVVTLGPFPIADGDISTLITDAGDDACSVAINVEAPAPCSDQCDIVSAGLQDILCDDNGTPTDPTDDTYTFVLVVTGSNVSDTWDSDLGISGSYGTPVTFGPYPISEGDKTLTITDAAEANCEIEISVPAPETCSDECAIEAQAYDILCLDSGTPSHKEDDVFEFKVVVTAINNPGSGWIASDGTTGSYGEEATFGPFPIDEGNRTLTIRSIDFPDCAYVLEVEAPEPCSDLCLIEAEVLASECDDNGTPDTSTDDFFTYTVTVTGLNIGDSWTASDGTTGIYGEPVTSVPHPVTGGEITIQITDNESENCVVEITVAPPPITIECPEDALRANIIRNGLVLEGSLEEEDARFADVDNLCWLPTELFQAGDHYYDLFTIQHTSDSEEPKAFTFYLFSGIPGSGLPMDLDGTGGVFFGPYYPEDPCCYLQTSDIRSRPLDVGQLLDNPRFETEGLFSQPYEPVVKFTVLLAPNQEYSLITTSLFKENVGDYAWLIVSDPEVELQAEGDIDIEKRVALPVSLELTFFDRASVLNNKSSLSTLGEPTLDNYCGVDSIAFNDRIIDLGECEDLTVIRQFKVYGLGQSEPLDSCEQMLTLARPSLDDIVLPPEAILYACDAEYDTLANGFPAPSSTGYPLILTQTGYEILSETHNYNLTIAYKDNVVNIPGSFTNSFRRDWTILDVCEDTLAQYSQLIKIGGFTDPVVACPVSNHYCPILEDNIMLFPLDPFECTATVEAPLPDIFNTCGEVDWLVRTEILQVVGADTLILATFEPGAERVITGLEPADYIFRYTVFDEEEEYSVEKLCIFRVADTQEPSAICRSDVTVDLGVEDGTRVFVEDINQGSYDNCGVEKVEIRRLYYRDPVTCDTLPEPTYSEWGNFVEFSCCDAGLQVTVEMRVTDIYGIENMCWLYVEVADGVSSVGDLSDRTVTCSDLPDDFDPADPVSLQEAFGRPEISTGCGSVGMELAAELNLSDCGVGTIIRRFQAQGLGGTTAGDIYTQTITITERLEYEIGFPADAVTDCINWADTVILQKAACDDLQVTYTDEFLDPVADECYRISRTYHVISYCEWDGLAAPVAISRDEDCNGQEGEARVWVVRRPTQAFVDQDFNPNNNAPAAGSKGTSCDGNSNPNGYWREVSSTGYWTYTQEVRVYDQTAPVISFETPDPVCTETAACAATVIYPFQVDDACVLETLGSFTIELDEGADGDIDSDLTGSGILSGTYPDFVLTGDFPIGSHAFVITVTDYCGNTATATMPFEVIDCYVPQPICNNEMVVNLEALDPGVDIDGDGMEDIAAITVSAEDLVSLSEAECTQPLLFSVNRVDELPDIERNSITFTCDDRYVDSLEIYVWDSAFNPYRLQPDGITEGGRNYSRCKMLIFIQDADNVCPDCEDSPMINGVIATQNGLALPMVDIEVSNTQMLQTPINKNGGFTLSHLAPGEGYTIAPHWDEGHRNGVTTLDLMLIRSHILGIKYLNSPYRMIAADVNNSGDVTALDLLEVRRLLLGETERFENNTSWRFVDMHYVFPDVYNPWKEVFPESVEIDELLTCINDLDFAAVKIGDVNESARFDRDTYGERGNEQAVIISAEDQLLATGDVVSLPLELLDAAKVLGFQFTLSFDPESVEVLGVEPGLLSKEHIGMRYLNEGAMTFSWDRLPESRPADEERALAARLELRAKAPVRLSEVFRLSSRVTMAEAYRSLGGSTEVQLQFSGSPAAALSLRLHQNRPNPFGDRTVIGFDLPEGGAAEIQVMDVSGRLVWQQKGEYTAGYHEMNLYASELSGSGMYYYTLRTRNGTLTKKFIVVNSQR